MNGTKLEWKPDQTISFGMEEKPVSKIPIILGIGLLALLIIALRKK